MNVQSATKRVETIRPKLGFFYVLLTSKGGNKALIPSPIPSMQCCAAVRATYRKQNTPTLNGVVRGGVQILLFSQVTLFE